jgi:hypothetical protein
MFDPNMFLNIFPVPPNDRFDIGQYVMADLPVVA